MVRSFCFRALGVHRRGAIRSCARVAACSATTLALAATSHAQYLRTDLVSDQPGLAAHQDPNLVNGWGVAFNPTGFAWVSSAGGSSATLYDGNGVPQSLVVGIPTPTAATGGAPTGIIYSGGTNFVVNGNSQSGAARFIWSTEEGAIVGWNPAVGSPPTPSTSGFVAANRSVGAV